MVEIATTGVKAKPEFLNARVALLFGAQRAGEQLSVVAGARTASIVDEAVGPRGCSRMAAQRMPSVPLLCENHTQKL